ncbi:protein DOWN-REGULATED IN DIF1 11-like [Vigna unguiculata]|uniref:protein DOWN-REGULATED IN DIF1 11-like n=1 Tax=Vigna unguiculata TaxID=3917 RepID=UPI001016B2D5|nr:protein DOWN-REGULATED IN DIF1 11-like [Vigna unguiculata]XP_027941071.1 protein DOWN-REGULATED IN DIF1 11-like [Vigna unguiculata]
MATFNKFCVIVVLTISLTLMVKRGVSREMIWEANDAARPLSSYEQYLQNCAAKLYPDCGVNIFSAIFFGNDTVTCECCDKLVNDVGKQCHDDMTKYILQRPDYRTKKNQILCKSDSVWNDCVSLESPALEPVAATFTDSVAHQSHLFM